MSVYYIGNMHPPTMPHHIGTQAAMEKFASNRIRIIQMKSHHKKNFVGGFVGGNTKDFVIIRWALGARRLVTKSELNNYFLNLDNKHRSVIINDGFMEVRDLLIPKSKLIKNANKLLKAEKINYGNGYIYDITNVNEFRNEIRNYINKN